MNSGLQPWVHVLLSSFAGQVGKEGVLREVTTVLQLLSSLWEWLCGPGFGLFFTNHTSFSSLFHEREVYLPTIHLLRVWYVALWWKNLGRQGGKQNIDACDKMWMPLIKLQIFSLHKITDSWWPSQITSDDAWLRNFWSFN